MTAFILKCLQASKQARYANLRAFEAEELDRMRIDQQREDIARRTERLDYLTSQAIRTSTLHR